MASSNSILPPGMEQLALKSDTKKAGGELGQTEFLKLMLTQIKHQDPLAPMENSEFLSQLAQFGTVNGVTQLQSSFEQFAASLQSSQALQASTLVGRSVLVQGNKFELGAAGSVQGAVDLEASTDNLTITISDQFGQHVKQINMGTKQAGVVQFNWEGLDDAGAGVAPGIYNITAQANINRESVSQQTLIKAKVESVTLTQTGAGPMLNLQGVGAIPISSVKEVM